MGEFLVLIFVTSGRILKSGSAQLKQSRVFGIHCYQRLPECFLEAERGKEGGKRGKMG